MRKALNENPAVQAGVVAVLLIVFVFILFTRVLGGGGAEEAPPPAEGTAVPATGGAASANAAIPAPETGVEPPATAESPAGDPLAAAANAGEFVPGPGLPRAVVKAYADGKAVVLLITRAKGIEDRRLGDQVDQLRSRDDVAVFTTSARGIARFSRITNGLSVDRAPALVVLRPRRASVGGPPQASVSYGFRGAQSVQQAVRDALYRGRSDIPYHPE